MFLYRSIVYFLSLNLFVSLLLFSGCRRRQSILGESEKNIQPVTIRYAQGFRLDTAGLLIRTDVLKPWQGKQIQQYRYFIGNFPDTRVSNDSHLIRIRKKIKRVICTSTTHIAFLGQLGELNSIVAISGKGLINNPVIRQKLKTKEISDIGYDKNMDYELIVRLHPDLVFLYGVGPEVTATVNRLLSLNIPSAIVGDYLEETPLGRAEWIKFMAAFFGKEKRAVSWFDSLVVKYNQARYKIKSKNTSPLVMTGLPWKEVWYVSGGSSLLASFIRDAGGTYVWQNLRTADAIPMDIEKVYRKASRADIWINCGIATSVQNILSTDKRLGLFNPVKTHQVYNNNARLSRYGGNDYWESGVIHPDIIVADMKHIFHPERTPGYKMIYYRHLK